MAYLVLTLFSVWCLYQSSLYNSKYEERRFDSKQNSGKQSNFNFTLPGQDIGYEIEVNFEIQDCKDAYFTVQAILFIDGQLDSDYESHHYSWSCGKYQHSSGKTLNIDLIAFNSTITISLKVHFLETSVDAVSTTINIYLESDFDDKARIFVWYVIFIIFGIAFIGYMHHLVEKKRKEIEIMNEPKLSKHRLRLRRKRKLIKKYK